MRSIGGFLVLMGVGSSVLYFLGMEFKLLMWIENWGPTVGWVIRGGLTVVGGALWFFGGKPEESAAAAEAEAPKT
jgi:hypothetical protein